MKLIDNDQLPLPAAQLPQNSASCSGPVGSVRPEVLPGSLVSVFGQLVGDDLRPVQPPEAQPLRFIHAARLGSARLGVRLGLRSIPGTQGGNPESGDTSHPNPLVVTSQHFPFEQNTAALV